VRVAKESGEKNSLGIAHHPAEAIPRSYSLEPARSLVGGGGSPPRGVLALHHGAAARTDLRAELVHASGYSLDVGDFMAA
jgi:hypothetical protein